jgi:AP-1 complex subunit gamma-1
MKELHPYIVQQLYKNFKDHLDEQSLIQVSVWCIGEYGEHLLTGVCEEDEPVQVRLMTDRCLKRMNLYR